MQIRFLLGPAGTGKTVRCLEEIREELIRAPLGAPLFLLAPRQATYQLERQLLEEPGLEAYTRLTVCPFDRLAAWILRQLNRPYENLLSEEGRQMVLRALLRRHGASLKVYRESSRTAGFPAMISRSLDELQRHRITADRLREVSSRLQEDSGLSGKLHDLALLLESYQAWLKEHQLMDAGSLFDLACDALDADPESVGRLRIAGLWMDGLAELTAQEVELLARLVLRTDRMTLAFCLEDEPSEEVPWISMWALLAHTFSKCRSRLSVIPGANLSIEVLKRESGKSRFSEASTLAHLERFWSVPKPIPDAEWNPGQIVLRSCDNPEEELRLAAREILEHVRNGGRYRECALLLRRLETHEGLLRRLFRSYGIPFFLDRREPVSDHPMIRLTRHALAAVTRHFRQQDILALMKTGLTGLDDSQVDALENEVLACGWTGGQWLHPLNTMGRIPEPVWTETLRRTLIGPLVRLKERLGEEPGGPAFAEAVGRYWEELQVQDRLAQWTEVAESAGRSTASPALHSTVWQQMEDWCQNIARAFRLTPLGLRDWVSIVESGLSSLSVGVIPPSLDQVLIGAVDRSRNPDLKLTVVAGMNEGVFPAQPERHSLLTAEERDRLETVRLNLDTDSRLRVGHERFLAYIAITRSRQRLVVSWSRSNSMGAVMNPSPFLDSLRHLFPKLEEKPFYWPVPVDEAVHVNELLPAAMRSCRENGSGVDNSLLEQPALAPWRHLLSLPRSPGEEALEADLIRELYGSRLTTSVSRLENFAACPFRFFVETGLRAEERELFQLDPRKTGTLMHDLLCRFHQELASENLRWRDVSPEEAGERVERIGKELVPEAEGGLFLHESRNTFQAQMWIAWIRSFVMSAVRWMDVYQFDPVVVEQAFGLDEPGALPHWELEVDAGLTVAFRGKIDRVDMAIDPSNPKRKLVCVIDYKSGNKKVDERRMRHGLQIQLPVYLAAYLALSRRTEPECGNELVPAGMFYVSPRSGGKVFEIREEAFSESDRFLHTGRLVREWIEVFDKDYASRPSGQFNFSVNKSGSLSKRQKDPCSEEELESMIEEAEMMIRLQGLRIFQGDISVSPYRKGTESACDYCDYSGICRIDPANHAFRTLS